MTWTLRFWTSRQDMLGKLLGWSILYHMMGTTWTV